MFFFYQKQYSNSRVALLYFIIVYLYLLTLQILQRTEILPWKIYKVNFWYKCYDVLTTPAYPNQKHFKSNPGVPFKFTEAI